MFDNRFKMTVVG